MDGFWEMDLKPWDIAGGALLVTEAGGRVSSLTGEAFSSRTGRVLATNSALHDQMLAVVGRYEASRASRPVD
jgi:myo-inositol-1(or 4)-monophosphatase